MKLYRSRFLVLLALAPIMAAPGQTGGMDIASLLAALASAGSAAAGTSSIASGNTNINQGQSTQNQAQMAMGAMQVAQGLLGLLAAAAAAAQAGKGQGNSNKMGTSGYDPASYQSTVGGTSPTPGSPGGTTGTSGTGNTSSNPQTVQLTPEALRTGELGTALTSVEKAFGINREDFLKALQNGVDPKAILANAPKNAMSLENLGKIEAGLAAMNAKNAENAVAGINSTGAGSLASVGGAGTGSAPTGASDSEKGPRMPASTAPPEDSLDDLNNPANANLSPEIKAALAAKAAQMKAEKEMREMHGWSIFQLVHNRYKKLEPMLYGRVERTNVRPVPQEL